MSEKLKKYETISACGIDCGLCPRFYTKGDSVCPGCGGLNFRKKHPGCAILTCCVIKNGFETCADCEDFPCLRFKNTGCDSFTTHKKMISNIENIKTNGIEYFIEKQKIRIGILSNFLTDFDDGRSKNFFCQACTLLPIEELQEVHNEAKKAIATVDLKQKNKFARSLITEAANSLDIDLKLRKKQTK